MKILFQVFSGSQSPIRISDDEEEEEKSATSSSHQYNQNTHGEFHFSIDNDSFGEPTTASEIPGPSKVQSVDPKQLPQYASSSYILSTPKKTSDSPKKAFNLSSLKQKMGGRLDKQMLTKNKELTKQKLTKSQQSSETASSSAVNTSQYENQIFDITSNFQKPSSSSTTETQQQPPLKKKRTTLVPFKASRRERLEKDLCSPPSRAIAQLKHKVLPKPAAVCFPTPKLPETTSKHKYTLDLFYNSILVWDPVWLEQGKDELEVSAKINAVPTSYDSFDDYMKINWPLMLLETWARLRKDWDEITSSSRKAMGVENIEERTNTNFLQCSWYELVTKENPRHSCNIFEQDLVHLNFNDGQCKLFGIVDSINKGFVNKRKRKVYNLNILTRKEASMKHFKRVDVLRITSLTTFLRQWNALIRFQNSLLCKDILKPFRPQTFSHKEKPIMRTDRLMKLNQDQFQAVSAAVRSVNTPYSIPKVCLIQGPPGTGKSYTIKTIITHLMQVC